jgi:hypothetical protein
MDGQSIDATMSDFSLYDTSSDVNDKLEKKIQNRFKDQSSQAQKTQTTHTSTKTEIEDLATSSSTSIIGTTPSIRTDFKSSGFGKPLLYLTNSLPHHISSELESDFLDLVNADRLEHKQRATLLLDPKTHNSKESFTHKRLLEEGCTALPKTLHQITAKYPGFEALMKLKELKKSDSAGLVGEEAVQEKLQVQSEESQSKSYQPKSQQEKPSWSSKEITEAPRRQTAIQEAMDRMLHDDFPHRTDRDTAHAAEAEGAFYDHLQVQEVKSIFSDLTQDRKGWGSVGKILAAQIGTAMYDVCADKTLNNLYSLGLFTNHTDQAIAAEEDNESMQTSDKSRTTGAASSSTSQKVASSMSGESKKEDVSPKSSMKSAPMSASQLNAQEQIYYERSKQSRSLYTENMRQQSVEKCYHILDELHDSLSSSITEEEPKSLLHKQLKKYIGAMLDYAEDQADLSTIAIASRLDESDQLRVLSNQDADSSSSSDPTLKGSLADQARTTAHEIWSESFNKYKQQLADQRKVVQDCAIKVAQALNENFSYHPELLQANLALQSSDLHIDHTTDHVGVSIFKKIARYPVRRIRQARRYLAKRTSKGAGPANKFYKINPLVDRVYTENSIIRQPTSRSVASGAGQIPLEPWSLEKIGIDSVASLSLTIENLLDRSGGHYQSFSLSDPDAEQPLKGLAMEDVYSFTNVFLSESKGRIKQGARGAMKPRTPLGVFYEWNFDIKKSHPIEMARGARLNVRAVITKFPVLEESQPGPATPFAIENFTGDLTITATGGSRSASIARKSRRWFSSKKPVPGGAQPGKDLIEYAFYVPDRNDTFRMQFKVVKGDSYATQPTREAATSRERRATAAHYYLVRARYFMSYKLEQARYN